VRQFQVEILIFIIGEIEQRIFCTSATFCLAKKFGEINPRRFFSRAKFENKFLIEKCSALKVIKSEQKMFESLDIKEYGKQKKNIFFSPFVYFNLF